MNFNPIGQLHAAFFVFRPTLQIKWIRAVRLLMVTHAVACGVFVCGVFVCAVSECRGQGTSSDYARMNRQSIENRGKVFQHRVEPHWIHQESALWYRLALGTDENVFVVVDLEKGIRKPAFDQRRVAEQLAVVLKKPVSESNLPFDSIVLDKDLKYVFFQNEGKTFKVDRTNSKLIEVRSSDIPVEKKTADLEIGFSMPSEKPIEISIENKRVAAIRLFWIDSQGKPQPAGRISAGQSATRSAYEEQVWVAADGAGLPLAVFRPADGQNKFAVTAQSKLNQRMPLKRDSAGRRKRFSRNSVSSPDGNYSVQIKDHNIVLVRKNDKQSTTITTDGHDQDYYTGSCFWAPDSKRFIVLREQPAQKRTVSTIESSPKDQLQPKLHAMNYLKPGDRIRVRKPVLVDVEKQQVVPVSDTLFRTPWRLSELSWTDDSAEFRFRYNQRGHQVMRLVGINSLTGIVRSIIDETAETFIDYNYKFKIHYLPETDEVIWSSERDGWNHLYLYDAKTGEMKNRMTSGKWLIRKIDRVDEDLRQIWFQAGGIIPNQDPYYRHHCRVDFSGENLVVMTRGDGDHTIRYSPSRRYLLDSYSRVDLPPVHEIRRVVDGGLVCSLESGDDSKLLATGWRRPQRFIAPGRDGETMIFGVVYLPIHYDPQKKYPVIEYIYAGPHGSFVPKSYASYRRTQALAELGFIVVQIDGMGTSNRSKAFHDVCWKNLGDSGFPDRIRWLQAAARKYSGMDLARVGIFGGSAGGQSALRALLAHGEFYKVAVADCGCHDNRMDKIWWNEQWMGWPIGPHYQQQSNVTQAHRLNGKLLLIVGELDRNVDPASTLQVVDALIRADKDFDFLLVPGGGHGVGSRPYGYRRTQDFFVRHLLNVEPRSSGVGN